MGKRNANNIFELMYVDYTELFDIRSFKRTPLVVFRSVTSRNSKWDLSKQIVDKYPHLQLSLNLEEPDYIRFNSIEIDRDPKTTVDIITIFVRLYDEDKNDEGLIGETNINQLNELIEKYGYTELFIEADMDFGYEWLDDVTVENKRLVIGE